MTTLTLPIPSFPLPISPTLLTALTFLLAVYLLLYRLQILKHHPNEPPVIPSALPFLGPLLGMALRGGRHLKQIGLRHRSHKIFTLPVPFSRLYIVTDPALAAAVQRASKTLSFAPLVPDITRRVLGLDDRTVETVRRGVEDEGGFLGDMHDMVYSYLGPGRELEELSLKAARELAGQVEDYVAGVRSRMRRRGGCGLEEVEVDLLVWIRGFVASGTGRLLYGAESPVCVRPSLQEDFWDFDHGLGGLLMGLWPRVTARRAYRGRERLVRAFEEWIAAGGYEREDVPEIVRRRVRIAREHGLGDEAVARSEVSFLFAGIVNTATTMFWTLVQVFARRELRDVVRCEVMGCVTVVDEVIEGSEDEEEDDDRKRGELSLEKLKRFCPTLMAVVKECLRLGSDNYSVRFVKTDTDLAGGEYRLKAGSVVQIAGGVIHADAGIWGENVDEFDHTRFLKTQQNGNGKGQAVEESQGEDLKEPRSRPQVQQTLSGGVHPAAFRAFGGGKTLCPGRHFAMNEILACVAVLVLAFDIEAADGSGQIKIPPKNDGVLPVHILEPTVPVKVVIRPRHDAPRIEVV